MTRIDTAHIELTCRIYKHFPNYAFVCQNTAKRVRKLEIDLITLMKTESFNRSAKRLEKRRMGGSQPHRDIKQCFGFPGETVSPLKGGNLEETCGVSLAGGKPRKPLYYV